MPQRKLHTILKYCFNNGFVVNILTNNLQMVIYKHLLATNRLWQGMIFNKAIFYKIMQNN